MSSINEIKFLSGKNDSFEHHFAGLYVTEATASMWETDKRTHYLTYLVKGMGFICFTATCEVTGSFH